MTPIMPNTKSPMGKDWNQFSNCFTQFNPAPEFVGVGLCHAYSNTVAIDIDRWDRAAIELATAGIDLQALYDAPDAVIIDSGRQGHGKLLYRLPEGMVLNSKKLLDTDSITGKHYNYLDFRCGTANGLTVQDVLPSPVGLHPDTGQPYRWAGKGHYSRLPQIPLTLLLFWNSLLAKDKERKIDIGATVNASWDEIQSALHAISPDVGRQDWVAVGMALRVAGEQTGQDAQAMTMWDEWSKGSPKYKGEREIMQQWSSFKSDKPSVVRLGTLYHMAKEAGWQRPTPDVTQLFKAIEDKTPLPEPSKVIKSLRPPPPSVDLSLFPPILATRAQEVATSVGCDPLVPLWAGLSAACGVAHAESRLQINDSFKVPPVLWLMTIGDPSDKKSPGSRPMFGVLEDLEREDSKDYPRRKLDWDGQEAVHAHQTKEHMRMLIEAPAGGHPENTVIPAPMPLAPPPEPLKIVVSDVTSQRLIRRAAANPRGLLCNLDEMNSWVKKVTDKNTGEDRSAWVSGYESQRYEMDRVGSGHIVAENYALSIFGNIQPKVLHQNMQSLASDGLLQRFMPAILDHDKTGLGHPVPDWMTTKSLWEQHLRLIFVQDAKEFKFSSEAYSVFRKFQVWYEETKRDYRSIGVSGDFMTAFGKLEGNVGRLCLVFHLLENPFNTEVSADVVERVIKFVKGYLIPAYNAVLGDNTEVDGFDTWLVEKIIDLAGDRPTITLSEIKRMARKKLSDLPAWHSDRVVTDGMQSLAEVAWVAIIDEDKAKKQITWGINDKLAVQFHDHRERIRLAKERLFGMKQRFTEDG